MPPPDRRGGFVRSLFEGRIESEAVLPFPLPDAETLETIAAVEEMVREWADGAIDPAAIDRDKTFPPEVLEGLSELGLYGLTIPEAHGGAGMGAWSYAKVMETLAHRCASTATILGAHLGIGLKGLLLDGTPEQKERWLPRLASGELIAAFALTEAEAGSDAAALRTRAEALPDGSWKLNGTKIWITNGGIANCFTVFARTPDPERPDAPLLERPISAFFVEKDAGGITIGKPEDKMGLCGSSTTEVAFEDTIVASQAMLGERGQGFKLALRILNGGRHGLAACCVGQAKLSRSGAVVHARERVQYGRSIGEFGMVQEMLAAMDADIYAMEAGTWLTAAMMERGEHETMLEAACTKMYATEKLWSVANDALQVTGGTGFMREYPYERILRDARINMIFEGTNQVLRMMLGSQGLRALVRGEARPPDGEESLQGVHEAFAAEREVFDALVASFAERCRRTVERHGKEVREAQFALHRLSDMAMCLWQIAAVLSRVSAAETGGQASDRERDVARLSCRRLEREFRIALMDEERPLDEWVARVGGPTP
jgi:acyl-CoA dehydrogenase family protein 9